MEYQTILRQNGSTFDAPGFSPGRLIDRLGVPAQSVGRGFRPLFALYRDRLRTAGLFGHILNFHRAGEACVIAQPQRLGRQRCLKDLPKIRRMDHQAQMLEW
jgi:hypothetical protein